MLASFVCVDMASRGEKGVRGPKAEGQEGVGGRLGLYYMTQVGWADKPPEGGKMTYHGA